MRIRSLKARRVVDAAASDATTRQHAAENPTEAEWVIMGHFPASHIPLAFRYGCSATNAVTSTAKKIRVVRRVLNVLGL